MNEQAVREVQPAEAPANSKWIVGLSPRRTVRRVASHVLDIRLKAVRLALPLAAEKSDEDVEHVHQFRIAVRRAVEAIRIFSPLMEEADAKALRDQLTRIRRAADEARNWDVMAERVSQDESVPTQIVHKIKARRRDVQRPIVAVYEEVKADACDGRIESLIKEIALERRNAGKRRFERAAPKYLASVVKKFFEAAESDLATEESLHALRIRSKKLRYTMEIVAIAFDSAFRKRLYPQVTLFQDLLGTVNDHATAKKLFGEWHSQAEDTAERAFLAGLLFAEQRATEDLRTAFLAYWTPSVVSRLKKQFRAYCGKV